MQSIKQSASLSLSVRKIFLIGYLIRYVVKHTQIHSILSLKKFDCLNASLCVVFQEDYDAIY